MEYKIINAISSAKVPGWGNEKKYIAIHYLGVDGQNHDLASDGTGAHYYIYWDGTIYQRCSHDAIPWAVGTAGYYTHKHPYARNSNTISIEMCCHNSVGSNSALDKHWWFTQETQMACAWLVKKLMKELGITIENVLRHYDIVNKVCPNPYVYNNKYKTSWTWDEFKARVMDDGRKKNSDGTYTVKEGDTLWAIAQDFDCSLAYLKKWNGINTDVIKVGQVLKFWYWYGVTVKENVPVKTDAGKGEKEVTRLKKGTVVQVTGSRRSAAGNKWYKIRYQGKIRYIYSKNVKKQ